MEWKPVVGFERRYKVSDRGDVYSHISARNLNPSLNSRGYYHVQLHQDGKHKNRPVHILVLEAFRGLRPDGKVARHLNNIKTDCRLCNLCWGTPVENIQDNLQAGIHSKQNLTVADVTYIRSRNWTQTQKEIFCYLLGISKQTFYKAQTSRTYADIQGEPDETP